MYEQAYILQNKKTDCCQLYIYHCTVYYANIENPDPENWKNE